MKDRKYIPMSAIPTDLLLTLRKYNEKNLSDIKRELKKRGIN